MFTQWDQNCYNDKNILRCDEKRESMKYYDTHNIITNLSWRGEPKDTHGEEWMFNEWMEMCE